MLETCKNGCDPACSRCIIGETKCDECLTDFHILG